MNIAEAVKSFLHEEYELSYSLASLDDDNVISYSGWISEYVMAHIYQDRLVLMDTMSDAATVEILYCDPEFYRKLRKAVDESSG